MNIDRQFPSDSLKDEARVWDQLVAPQLRLPRNVFDICRHGFTEILNNVIDHANSTTVMIRCAQDARNTRLDVEDDGMGVFASLRNHFGFDSDIHALMELTKGKLTVAPLAHSGEGIFFSSKMFDQFVIESGDLSATFDSHKSSSGKWRSTAASPPKLQQRTKSLHNAFLALTDDELDRLADFLLSRVGDDVDTRGMDEGVLTVSELDGLFTAVVSGPVMIPPSQWLPAVWRDFPPTWTNEQEAQQVLSLMMRHMNSVATTLMEHPAEFEPIFMERQVKGKAILMVDDWCDGYGRGVELATESWMAAGDDIAILLVPILAFTAAVDWPGHKLTGEDFDNAQNAITPHARAIHAYWLARRAQTPSVLSTARNASPRTGRNDPCPCGSGKKYKKCCLN